MKTPNLIDVPKDSPTRKERLQAFKAKHGIQTHCAGPNCERDIRWLAVLFDESWKRWSVYCKGDKTLFGLMAGACRLVDESEYSGYGPSELSAIRQLCTLNNIPFQL